MIKKLRNFQVKKMRNILVTGGAGYIGSNITEMLLSQKYNVFIVDNLSKGYRTLINKKAKFYKTDINKSGKIKKIINQNKIELSYSFSSFIRCK